MNPRIQHLINHPFEVQLSDVALLQDEIEKYPYFSTLRTLLLFGLKEYDHSSYQDELKKTSIYCPSRVALYHYLQKEKQISTEIFEKEEQEELIDNHPVTIDSGKQQVEISVETSRIEEKIESEDPIILVEETDHNSLEKETLESEEKTTSLEETTHSSFTFSEWLTLSQTKKEIKEPSPIHTPSEKDIKFQLIEEFIEKSPKISPVSKDFVSNPLMGKSNSSEEYSDLMTETLAQIYTEQKKYDKAIRAYKILMIKYPEKQEFFSDKIDTIEYLKNPK